MLPALFAAALAVLAFGAASGAGSGDGREVFLRLQARDGVDGKGLARVGLDVGQAAAVADFGQGDGQAVAPGAARAANAVGVVLGLHGQAVVEDVREGGHVQPARGHVGGHEDLHAAVAQGFQAPVAQGLAERAVQGDGCKARLLQVLRKVFAFHLRAGKDDGLVDFGAAQPVVEQGAAVFRGVGPVKLLLDVGVALLRRGDFDALCVRAAFAHDAHGQLLDARGEGGRKHHGLLALLGLQVDFGQRVGKAQIEHAVGFVKHEKAHAVQPHLAAGAQVQQAARRGDNEVGVLQPGDLHLVGHAAHDGGDAQAAHMAHQLDGVARHLLRQLARGAQHQRAGHGGLEVAAVGGVFAAGFFGGRLAARQGLGHAGLPLGFFALGGFGLHADERVQHGQQEGGGFAAARLAAHHQVNEGVAARLRQGQRNGLLLYGRGRGVAHVGHGLHQLRGQAQGGEGVFAAGVSGVGGFAAGGFAAGAFADAVFRRFAGVSRAGGGFVAGRLGAGLIQGRGSGIGSGRGAGGIRGAVRSRQGRRGEGVHR